MRAIIILSVTFATLPTIALSQASSCAVLNFQRNSFYKEAGYCFKTAEQIRIFGNSGCKYDNQIDVPLSQRERAMIAEIIRDERAMGCR